MAYSFTVASFWFLQRKTRGLTSVELAFDDFVQLHANTIHGPPRSLLPPFSQPHLGFSAQAPADDDIRVSACRGLAPSTLRRAGRPDAAHTLRPVSRGDRSRRLAGSHAAAPAGCCAASSPTPSDRPSAVGIRAAAVDLPASVAPSVPLPGIRDLFGVLAVSPPPDPCPYCR